MSFGRCGLCKETEAQSQAIPTIDPDVGRLHLASHCLLPELRSVSPSFAGLDKTFGLSQQRHQQPSCKSGFQKGRPGSQVSACQQADLGSPRPPQHHGALVPLALLVLLVFYEKYMKKAKEREREREIERAR